ncbi:MAG: tRNA uridine-5-carboxymethylaminomethyl(34) synthesis enzyme MnmG [Deltaproteobacteria bacterium]
MPLRCDVVVVGLGHAGVEAAFAAARLGRSVIAITHAEEKAGLMSCNPAIGGPGKSQLVAEIDALGGVMARASDACCIQVRRLNRSKGAALHATREQVDRGLYPKAVLAILRTAPSLTIVEGEVSALLVEGGRIEGVRLATGEEAVAQAVVLTTGTFLAAAMHVGAEQQAGGRAGDPSATGLSRSLRGLGLRLGRFKTGTPPRLDGKSIDWEGCVEQPTEPGAGPLSRSTVRATFPTLPQRSCFLTHTTRETQRLVEGALGESPLFTGAIQAKGPRYCPSLEHKMHFHSGKAQHPVYLEPDALPREGAPDVVYPAGLSTSLPVERQLAALRTIPGLGRVELLRAGYAVEYDYLPATQLDPSLGVRSVSGLYLAGQINGSSGYEEAAGQGLVAGLNAARFVTREAAYVPAAGDSYLGVLIRDLTTVGFDEPYRLLPARAEGRLMLREDNALARLWRVGVELGLLPPAMAGEQRAREREMAEARSRLSPDQRRRLRRPETDVAFLRRLDETKDLPDEALEQLFLDERYGPYESQRLTAERRLAQAEGLALPPLLNLGAVVGLSEEARAALLRGRPKTLGEAGRLPGMTVSALAILAAHLRRRERLAAS